MTARRPPGKPREANLGLEPQVRSDHLGLLQRLIGVGSCFLLGVLAGTNLGSEPPVPMAEARVALSPGGWKRLHFYVGGSAWTLGQRGQLHSQCGQDWLVLSMLGCKRSGFFLDLAANDARVLSNTLLLERDFGWRGLCIEANTEYVYGLGRRSCDLVLGAAGASGQEVTFNLRGVGGGIVGSDMDNKEASGQSVSLRTVAVLEILESRGAPRRIDFFSLDVEGAESLVMQGFNWTKYRFSIIGVERPKPDLSAALDTAGYKVLRRNAPWGDFFYVDSRMPGYAEIAKTWRNNPQQGLPASCLDSMGYLPPVDARWRTYERQEQLEP